MPEINKKFDPENDTQPEIRIQIEYVIDKKFDPENDAHRIAREIVDGVVGEYALPQSAYTRAIVTMVTMATNEARVGQHIRITVEVE